MRKIYQTFMCAKCRTLCEIPDGWECLDCHQWLCAGCARDNKCACDK